MAASATTGQTIDVVTPAAGESVTEGTILEWRVKVGDAIKLDDTIVEISTDKVDVELPSPASGTVSEILAQEGDTVTVGQVIARIAVGGDGKGASPAASGEDGSTGNGQPPSTNGAPSPNVSATPVAARAAAAEGVDLTTVSGSGPAGRIVKADVLDAAAGNGATMSGASAASGAAGAATDGGAGADSAGADGAGADGAGADGAGAAPAGAELMKGGAAALARYMEQSRSIPTATSFRTLTVTALDARRRELKTAGRKVSFTHLIAYAIARAAEDMPVMAHHFAEIDGKPHRVVDGQVNLGLAVDVEKKDGSRTLMVPVIANAAHLSFERFLAAYDALVEKARTNTLTADDLKGANITLTNPGGLGTVASVPRLMNGQGTIVATGSIGYPVGLGAIGAMIGAEKVMTMTSTYDHRVIQGAESGRFLARIEEYLQGELGFYDGVFASLGAELGPAPAVPAPAAAAAAAASTVEEARRSGTPRAAPDEELLQAVQSATALLKAFRTHGHLAARLDPLGTEPEGDPALDPEPLGLTPELMAQIPAKILRMWVPGATLADALPHLRETYCGTIAYEIEHISSHRQRVWLREKIESGTFRQPLTNDEQQTLLKRLIEVDALERFMHKAYLGQHQFSIEGLDMTVPMLDELIQLAAAHGGKEVVIGMAHRGRLNVLAHNLGRPYDTIFAEFEGASTLEAVTTIPQGGTGDVKYHHGTHGSYELPGGETIQVNLESNPSHLEYVSAVVEGATRAAQTTRKGPPRPPGHRRRRPDRDPRRRLLPRPGRRRRDAQPAGARRLQGRRHRARHHQQPDRLHHRPRRRALHAVGLRSGEGLRRADHPRQRRRRPRLHERRAPRFRLPQGIRPRRADRPDRVPPLRPQRVRRARLHAAGDVREDQGAQARGGTVGRAPDRRRGRHQGADRPAGAGGVGQPHHAAPAPEGEDRRRRRERLGQRHRRIPARPLPLPRSADGGAGRATARARQPAAAHPRRLHRAPQARQTARAPPRRAAGAQAAGMTTPASTGRTRRRSRSPRC